MRATTIATRTPAASCSPKGELFSDPQAKLVWAALETVPEAQLHLVLARLQETLLVPDARGGTRRGSAARCRAA